jgi:hypothetical protein
MEIKRYCPTKKQTDAIYAAIDFISSNTDSAADQKYYQQLNRNLKAVWFKAIAFNVKLNNQTPQP